VFVVLKVLLKPNGKGFISLSNILFVARWASQLMYTTFVIFVLGLVALCR